MIVKSLRILRCLACPLTILALSACQVNQDPLAVLTTDKLCVEVGEGLTFSAAGSYDPEGGELVYSFDFGDGGSAAAPTADHAYAQAGAYRVVLTVTDDQGAVDVSSQIVSVGEFPTGAGDLNELAFSPNHFNGTIKEEGERPLHGGLIYGYFTAPFDTTPDTIMVNGQPAQPESGEVEWCELVERELRAGQVGILRCHSYSANVDAGAPVAVEVLEGETPVWSVQTTLPEPSLTPSYITSNTEGTEILVHVRNDSERPLVVTGLSIDGMEVSRFVVIEGAEVDPSHVAILRVPRCDGVPFGEWKVFTVHGTDGSQDLSVSRSLRLYPPLFPVGDWNSGSDDIFHDMELLRKYLDAGINMFIYYPSPENPPELVLGLAETHDFFLFTHAGDTDAYFEEFVATWGRHPRILTNAVSGEGEFNGNPIDALRTLQRHRDLWGSDKPLWVYNACSYQFPSWGALADVSGMDHYCVWAPKCNYNWPPFYWDEIKFAGYYAAEIKRAAEPRPVWNWAQGLSTTWDLRCTTADEIRSQWYQVLGRGTKGILWFQYTESWAEKCPSSSTDEVVRLARELASLKEILLEGEVAAPGTVASTSQKKIDVSATVSPHGIALFLTNLNYCLHLILPYTWNPALAVSVDVTPPQGLEPMDFLLLQGDQKVPLHWERISERLWRFYLPSLKVAEAVVVVPEP